MHSLDIVKAEKDAVWGRTVKYDVQLDHLQTEIAHSLRMQVSGMYKNDKEQIKCLYNLDHTLKLLAYVLQWSTWLHILEGCRG